MNIEKLPLNDTLAQFVRKCNNTNEEEIKKMKECNHLFVLLEKGKTSPGFHSTDYEKEEDKIECIHCGLTNKFMELEKRYLSEYSLPKTSESIIFSSKYYKNYTESPKTISSIPLPSFHLKLLFEVAKTINPDANLEELYDIMLTLHSIETTQEKLRLQTIEQTDELINRYIQLTKNEDLSKERLSTEAKCSVHIKSLKIK